MKNKMILLVGAVLILASCATAPLTSTNSDQTQMTTDEEISPVSQGVGA